MTENLAPLCPRYSSRTCVATSTEYTASTRPRARPLSFAAKGNQHRTSHWGVSLTLKPSRRTSDHWATRSQTRNATRPADDNQRAALPKNVVRGRLFSYNPRLLGNRLAVGQRTLDPLAEVRILVPQPDNLQAPPNATSSTKTMRMPAEIPSRKLQPSRRICTSQNQLPVLDHRTHRHPSCLPYRPSMTTS